MNEQLIVKYVPTHNCFVYLPNKYCTGLTSQVCAIKIINNESPIYLSHSTSQLNNTSNSLFINATFAQSLNIVEGSNCTVTRLADPPSLTSITVSARTKEDLSIIKLKAQKIQTILLNQITIVAEGQSIVIWLSKGLSVTVIVNSILPNFKYGKIEQHTEVHVLESVKIPEKSSKPTGSTAIIDESRDINNFLTNFRRIKLKTIFRVAPLLDQSIFITDLQNIPIKSSFYIFISHSQSKYFFPESHDRSYCFCKIDKIRKTAESTNFNFGRSDKNQSEPKDCVMIAAVTDKINNTMENNFTTFGGNVLVSKYLQQHLQLNLGDKITLEPVVMPEETIDTVELLSPDANFSREIFHDYIRQFYPQKVLINSGMRLILGRYTCDVNIIPASCCCTLIDVEKLQELKIEIKNTKIAEIPDNRENIIKSNDIFLPKFTEILSECLSAIEISMNSHLNNRFIVDHENILICGDTGMGKSVICRKLAEKMIAAPNYFYTNIVECRKLKGKKLEVFQKMLISLLNDCCYYQPSVIFFDDLECLTNAGTDEENTPDTINAARIADMFLNTINDYQSRHLISIVVTCGHLGKLGSQLSSSKGLNLFRTIVKLPNLNANDRIEILKSTLNDKLNSTSQSVNWDFYATKTEGWVIQDIVDYAEKSAFIAWKRQINIDKLNDNVEISNDDLVQALEDFQPISLRNLKLYKGKGYNWTDIGGLDEVKENLVQLLQWPLKYSELFKDAPIKEQNGVLLYGMPGTGKTMLAGAIAKECGLNFITIKGPELISKYIGASEEAVRDLFEKAKRAKPCVLFFDEFESLAPRRGHDSTGVTDRVVNQLLTQFDGVEGREGVAIVAASSRPDLLDSALLRPGRLDKLLLCPLPGECEREKILNALCKTNSIDIIELDLKKIAKLSTGFTGADLNSILAQARLNAYEEKTTLEPSVKIESIEEIKITQDHLMRSLESTQPSLSVKEIAKFHKIYNQFSKGDSFTEDLMRNQKSTLA